MIWDNTNAENCQEMFNVSKATLVAAPSLPNLSSNVLWESPTHSSQEESWRDPMTPLQRASPLQNCLWGGGHSVPEEIEREGLWIWNEYEEYQRNDICSSPTASPNVACFPKRVGKRKSIPDYGKNTDKWCRGKWSPKNRFHSDFWGNSCPNSSPAWWILGLSAKGLPEASWEAPLIPEFSKHPRIKPAPLLVFLLAWSLLYCH